MTNRRSRTSIETWLFRNSITYAEAGRLFGCSGQYVHAVAIGKKTASSEIGEQIRKAASADTSLEDLRARATQKAQD